MIRSFCTSLTLCTLMAAGTAVAADSAAPSGADTGTLTEVVVTARRFSENLQNVPLAVTALAAAPLGHHGGPNSYQRRRVRVIVLHLIEEPAAHSGHLEIARELIDGRTGLGLR